MPIQRFQPNYWGRLQQFQVPYGIVKDDRLVLGSSSLLLLLILMRAARGSQYRSQQPLIEVKITNESLRERSGYSKNMVTRALKDLTEKRFIRCCPGRRMRGEFGASTYLLCNPEDGIPLDSTAGGSFLHAHGIRYINIPACLIAQSESRWSLANMSGSEARLYVSLCWLANKHSGSQFSTTAAALTKLAAFSTNATTAKTLNGLTEKALLSAATTPDTRDVAVQLFDPYTGEPLHDQTGDPEDDPANYYARAATGRATRVDLNNRSPEVIEQHLRSCLPERAIVIKQSNGDLMIACPFHPDDTPSCSVSPAKRCFHCFGCLKDGTLTNLLAKLGGGGRGAAINGLAQATGDAVDFHLPDSSAEAIYSYRDSGDKLVKEVLRYPVKKFLQRRPAPGGTWIWNLNGVKPLLYNALKLECSDTVVICEGEKDCDTVMALSLWGPTGGQVVATTSGSSDSWKDELAVGLIGKRVILLRDDDEAGARYADAIISSLAQRRIEYRVVGFGDVGCNDVSDFIAEGHSKEELVGRIGTDWVVTSEPSVLAIPTGLEEA